MGKTLGLDLGTNSIGWAILEKEDNKAKLLDKGVLIFTEGVKNENGNESSRSAERTSYRSARKLKFRRKLRKYETLRVLVQNKMCPLSLKEVEDWRKSNFKKYPTNPGFLEWLKTDEEKNKNPYLFRAKASIKKIDEKDLGRAFYHMAQRRGFLSNRLDTTDNSIVEDQAPEIEQIIEESCNLLELQKELDSYFNTFDKTNEVEKPLFKISRSFYGIIKNSDMEIAELKNKLKERLYRKENLGDVKSGISDLTEKMQKSYSETMGQYFNSLYPKNKIRKHYTARKEHYLHEFETICKTQGLPSINPDEKAEDKKYSGLVLDLYKAIFYQRPLKSQKGLVGKCSFEKNKPRCPVSHPLFEEFRMWSFINNIKMKAPEDEKLRPLTSDEKQKIVPKFYRKANRILILKNL